MEVNQTLVLDFKRNGMPPMVEVAQGDANSRVIKAMLLSGGVAWNIPDGIHIFVCYQNSDSSNGVYDSFPDGSAACIPNGNVMTIRLAEEACIVPGITHVAISMVLDDVQLSTFRFRLCVDPDPRGGHYPGDYVNLNGWFKSHQIVGPNGATFVPKIEDGYLTWINDKNLPNPAPFYVGGSDIEIGNTFEPKRLQFENVTVPKTAFVSDTTYADLGYPYRAAIPLVGVLPAMTPDVTFSVADVVTGLFAPVCACYAGGVYIWAASVPDGAILIHTIECRKQV